MGLLGSVGAEGSEESRSTERLCGIPLNLKTIYQENVN